MSHTPTTESMTPWEPSFGVVWPLSPVHRAEQTDAVPRLGQLSGKRIGLIWDYLFHGDRIFEVLREHVHAHFEDVTFVGPEIFGNIHGPDEDEIIAALPNVVDRERLDSIVAAVGA